ncbi:ATP-binding protein [Catenibacillus scindens]|uniref:ATP-binding protein n=1 Tax=Catenibacillus scindens TaxID=673271 RepID=UPI003209B44D
MMTEIALNVLDVAQNSVRAQATLVCICVTADTQADRMDITIEDNGCGMSPEEIRQVEDPFFTTRKTRKVGLGVPFFKYSAQCTGGDFKITSTKGQGTKVSASYVLSSIDRMPLGDMPGTVHTLVTLNTHIDFVYTYTVNGRSFTLDTREFRDILGDVPLNAPEVSSYIEEYLWENTREVNQDIVL